MKIKKFSIYSADLKPKYGTEPGKVRPVVVAQTNLINDHHPSTIILPITSKINSNINFFRVRLNDKKNNLLKESDILIDQIRAIDNKRLKKEIGTLSKSQRIKVEENLKTILFE